jgi:ABC-type proline/glycine betaine transport system permease subunit
VGDLVRFLAANRAQVFDLLGEHLVLVGIAVGAAAAIGLPLGVLATIREAARGMGMTDGQLLTRVELPLAAGVIVAGVRVAAVISIGIATIAAAIGAGGLGVYIFQGLAMVDDTVILAGAVPAALLALVADAALGRVARRLTPPGVVAGSGDSGPA